MEEIREVILARAAQFETGDVKALLAHSAPRVVQMSLAPPLVQDADNEDTAPIEQWLSGFEAPPRRTVTQLEITADGDVAFATSIDSITATPKGSPEPFTLWFRVTLGLRRIDGRWLVTHQHESVPFHMDAEMRAAVDLQP